MDAVSLRFVALHAPEVFSLHIIGFIGSLVSGFIGSGVQLAAAP